MRLGALLLPLILAGCSSTMEKLEKINVFGSSKNDGLTALPDFKPKAELSVLWQASVGAGGDFLFAPAEVKNQVFAASESGKLTALDAASGKPIWEVDAGKRLSSGAGYGNGLVLLGTMKGEVLAYDQEGKPLWQARVSSEVLAVPQAGAGVVVVRTGDGRIFGLDAADGKRKWLYQRATPALSLRSHAGAAIERGGVFAGFASGKLVAIELASGRTGWEASVALPKGTTELERIADITSAPVVDGNEVYAVAYQGRLAAINLASGNISWSRELSSVSGLTVDRRNVYLADTKGVVFAFDKVTGASMWRQEKLAGRQFSQPLVFGNYLVLGDQQGLVHVLSRDDGSFVARLATDGSAIRAQPLDLDRGFLVQTKAGGLFALTVR
jgi:outer membrane protein assembly factor BamB